MKKICYVIPVYNSALTISKSLLSINSFKYALEVIVINDNSTDNSLKIIQGIKKDLPYELLVINNQVNIGISASLNKGIELAISRNAHYILRLDGDDYNNIGRTDFQVEFMESNPHIMICSSNAKLLKGNSLKKSILLRLKSFFENQFRPYSNLVGSLDLHPTFCIRINPFVDYGIRYGSLPGFLNKKFFIKDGIEDLLFINLVIFYYGINSIYRHVDKELITYRINDKGLTSSTILIRKRLMEKVLDANKILYKVNSNYRYNIVFLYYLSDAIAKHHYKNIFLRNIYKILGLMILYINYSNYFYKLLVLPIMIFIIPRLIIQSFKPTN